ncbi:hypothetical protein GGX14DRAFT_405901 [Mycena pura]|uniref:Uncharacterized protein n=1 Tax=Mycena pura TaxID=153505 RepID=A0AAD6UT20_9AGAR|nr:hypothetical protein GGX14DRAFT_405901 [Mycena pura]
MSVWVTTVPAVPSVATSAAVVPAGAAVPAGKTAVLTRPYHSLAASSRAMAPLQIQKRRRSVFHASRLHARPLPDSSCTRVRASHKSRVPVGRASCKLQRSPLKQAAAHSTPAPLSFPLHAACPTFHCMPLPTACHSPLTLLPAVCCAPVPAPRSPFPSRRSLPTAPLAGCRAPSRHPTPAACPVPAALLPAASWCDGRHKRRPAAAPRQAQAHLVGDGVPSVRRYGRRRRAGAGPKPEPAGPWGGHAQGGIARVLEGVHTAYGAQREGRAQVRGPAQVAGSSRAATGMGLRACGAHACPRVRWARRRSFWGRTWANKPDAELNRLRKAASGDSLPTRAEHDRNGHGNPADYELPAESVRVGEVQAVVDSAMDEASSCRGGVDAEDAGGSVVYS